MSANDESSHRLLRSAASPFRVRKGVFVGASNASRIAACHSATATVKQPAPYTGRLMRSARPFSGPKMPRFPGILTVNDGDRSRGNFRFASASPLLVVRSHFEACARFTFPRIVQPCSRRVVKYPVSDLAELVVAVLGRGRSRLRRHPSLGSGRFLLSRTDE